MKVPFYRHSLKPEDFNAVSSVLTSPILTSGPVCHKAEETLAEFFAISGVKLVNSWTNGAVATLLALDIGPGDEVIVPAMTFIATANVVELVGAKPIFVDVDPDTFLIQTEKILEAITNKTKAIIPVHMYGQMFDVKRLRDAISKFHKIFIIEDSAHAFEARLNDLKCGANSDVAIFSFYATKNVTCGEGGAIVTKDLNLLSKIQQTVLHGMTAGAADRFKSGQYKHWGMERLGTKANLPDILAALLPNQIQNVYQQLAKREKIAQFYDQYFASKNIEIPKIGEGVLHARHLYPVGVPSSKRDLVIKILGENGIGTTVNYKAVPTMTYYKQKYKYQKGDFPVSEEWGNQTLTLPLFPDLNLEELEYIVKVFETKVFPVID